MDDAQQEKEIDHYQLPSPEVLRDIERRQNQRAKEIRERHQQNAPADERANAAEIIQRNYRGYRDRRALKGHGLDPSTRWLEALKDANYSNKTKPQSREQRSLKSPTGAKRVRDQWVHATTIAKRVGSDDTSEDEGDEKSRKQSRLDKSEREKYAKTMGLEYFLELVDQKHRYGSNLRRYHKEWKAADTKENFFYWLDYGEGKELDLEDRPRRRLDSEFVRYLSREERRNYLVRIDAQGRFIWDRDGKPITTSMEYKDSIEGIVHRDSDKPTWREVTTGEKPDPALNDDSSSVSTGISTGSHENGAAYVNEEFHDAKGLQKLNHVNVDALMNHLLRKTTKSNTWIFVADTSFRLYVGIKQSGAFQHSSFLKGARVSAAGLIKIKRGQIRKLSPLSGHYAPPVKNFREFLKSLKQAGADLSRLNVSRSYAVILGLEGYLKVKKKGREAKQGVKDMMNPEEKRRREEAAMDKSQSAQREREILAKEERERRGRSMSHRFMKRMGLREEQQLASAGQEDGAASATSTAVDRAARPKTPKMPEMRDPVSPPGQAKGEN